MPLFRETIASVLAQTDSDWEWVIVDDASIEPITASVEAIGDRRIRVIRQERGIGQTAALNLGIREARGEWVVRIDGDDLCEPDRLRATREAVDESPSAFAVFSDYSVIDERGRFVAEIRYRDAACAMELGAGLYRYLLRRNNPVCHPTVSFRRADQSGELTLYNEALLNAQDYELWRRLIARHGPCFRHIPRALVRYRVVQSSLSGARIGEQTQELRAIRAGQVSGSVGPALMLGARKKEAMQAYRLLYYGFLGSRVELGGIRGRLRQLSRLFSLPRQLPKGLAWFLLAPVRGLAKLVLFSGLYR